MGHEETMGELEEQFDPFEDYDPNSHLWFISLMFPRPAKLDDDQMEIYFPDRDGRWSFQTRKAMERAGAAGLELNANWALTSPGWICPGCGRNKQEIMRLSNDGILLAKLELHHDHLWDKVNRRPQELYGPDWKSNLAQGVTVVLETIRSLVTRFDEALICSDCNSADGTAKRQLEIDGRFSFTATEIREFVHPSPNADHKIDVDAARVLWLAQKESFERRLSLLDVLVHDLVSGHLQRRLEGTSPARPQWRWLSEDQLLTEAFRRDATGSEKRQMLSGFRAEFLARSCQNDGPSKKRKANDLTSCPTPTDEEYAAYTSPVSPKTWTSTPEDWHCPCCNRLKREIVRKSAQKKWTGSIRSVFQYAELHDDDEKTLRIRLFPEFRNERFVGSRWSVDICSDCADIGPRLQQKSREIGFAYLSLADMEASLLKIRPHGPHEVDFCVAKDRALANESLGSAIDAWGEFTNFVAFVQTRMKSAARFPETRRIVFDELDMKLEYDRNIKDPDERKSIMKWLKDRKPQGEP